MSTCIVISDLTTVPITKESALDYFFNHRYLLGTKGTELFSFFTGPVVQSRLQAAAAAATRHVLLRTHMAKCVLCTQKIIVWAKFTPRSLGRFTGSI